MGRGFLIEWRWLVKERIEELCGLERKIVLYKLMYLNTWSPVHGTDWRGTFRNWTLDKGSTSLDVDFRVTLSAGAMLMVPDVISPLPAPLLAAMSHTLPCVAAVLDSPCENISKIKSFLLKFPALMVLLSQQRTLNTKVIPRTR